MTILQYIGIAILALAIVGIIHAWCFSRYLFHDGDSEISANEIMWRMLTKPTSNKSILGMTWLPLVYYVDLAIGRIATQYKACRQTVIDMTPDQHMALKKELSDRIVVIDKFIEPCIVQPMIRNAETIELFIEHKNRRQRVIKMIINGDVDDSELAKILSLQIDCFANDYNINVDFVIETVDVCLNGLIIDNIKRQYYSGV